MTVVVIPAVLCLLLAVAAAVVRFPDRRKFSRTVLIGVPLAALSLVAALFGNRLALLQQDLDVYYAAVSTAMLSLISDPILHMDGVRWMVVRFLGSADRNRVASRFGDVSTTIQRWILVAALVIFTIGFISIRHMRPE